MCLEFLRPPFYQIWMMSSSIFDKKVRIQDGGSDHIENVTFRYCIVIVCVSVRVFRRQQKSQGHEILARGLILAYLKHDKA